MVKVRMGVVRVTIYTCTCIYTYMHAHVYVCVYTHVCVYIHACIGGEGGVPIDCWFIKGSFLPRDKNNQL